MQKKTPVKKTAAFLFEDSPSYWVYRIRIKADAALRKAFQEAGYDLTPEQWSVLVRLCEEEGMSQCRLGEKTLKDRHNMTRILNRLEKKGLIERRRCAGDRRSFGIYPTETGRKAEANLSRIVLSQRPFRYKGVSEQDLLVLKRVLQRILKNLDEYLSGETHERPGGNIISNGV